MYVILIYFDHLHEMAWDVTKIATGILPLNRIYCYHQMIDFLHHGVCGAWQAKLFVYTLAQDNYFQWVSACIYIYIYLFGLNQFRSFKTKATPHKPTIQYLDYMNELVQNHQVIWGLTSPFEPSIKRPSQSPPSIDSMCFLGTTIYGWVSWKIPI